MAYQTNQTHMYKHAHKTRHLVKTHK